MEKTNLDVLREHFKKADFIVNEDRYDTKWNGFDIQWCENEFFVVNRTYFDCDVGYVTDTDLFGGNFNECLKYILDQKMVGEII